MNRFLLDLNFNIRLLRRTPMFTGICFVVITIGITVALSIYNMLYEITKRPPDIENGNRYVSVRLSYADPTETNAPRILNSFAFNVVRKKAKGFDLTGAIVFNEGVLQAESTTVPVAVARVTPELFGTAQQPLMGRVFSPSDAVPGASPSVLLSSSTWKQYFNADENIVGKSYELNGNHYTVIGVVPDQSNYFGVSDVYLPLYISPQAAPEDQRFFHLFGRLQKGISFQEAGNELNTILAQLSKEYPDIYFGLSAEVRPINSFIVNMTPTDGGVEEGAAIVQWIAIAIFLLVGVNLASLLFLRANSRQQELALRNAMGSSLWGISKQVLIESFILCFAGTVAGLFSSILISESMAEIYNNMMTNLSLGRTPFRYGLTGHMLGSAVILLLLLWLFSSAISVYYLARKNILHSMNDANKGNTGYGKALLTKAVVSVEVVLCCFLLVICGLLSVAVYRVFSVDPGVDFENRFSGYIDLTTDDFADPQKRFQFVDTFNQLLLEEPTIEAVTASYTVAGLEGLWIPYALADRELKRDGLNPIIMQNSVANNYHQMMNIPLLEGRHFDNSDSRDTQAVAIVGQPFAEAFWPGESAIGKRFQINTAGPSIADFTARADPQWVTIVGVTAHVLHATPVKGGGSWWSFYRPLSQYTPYRIRAIAQTKNQQSIQSVEQILQRNLNSIDRSLVIHKFNTLSNLSSSNNIQLLLLGRCSAAMGLGAIVLSFIAIFGVVSRSVALRTAEIGIRRALGSTNRQALNIFIKQGAFYLLLGVSIGGAGAIVTANVISILFPDILGLLPQVGVSVLLTIGLFILLASWLPAKQAIALEPGDALRHE